jgi:hypothetical protein
VMVAAATRAFETTPVASPAFCRIVISSVTFLLLFCPASRIAVVVELPEARSRLGFQAEAWH